MSTRRPPSARTSLVRRAAACVTGRAGRVARRPAILAGLCLVVATARPSICRRVAAILFATAILAGLCLEAPAAAVATSPDSPVAPGRAAAGARPALALPPQGLYEGCAPGAAGDVCAAHLARISAAGFRYVLNYSAWYGSPEEVLAYADAAAALGLQLIWPLNHPAWRGLTGLVATYATLAESGVSSDRAPLADAELLDSAIDLVASHPATWGFYIGDELPPAEAGLVAGLSATVRRLAPDKPQLYVARPGAAQLEPFAPFADVAGVDAYPVGSGDPPVRQAARGARAIATEAGVQTAMVLQAFAWSQYRPSALPPRYPNARSLRMMRDAAIRHADPSLILWYSYQDILRSDRPRQRWCELSRAAFSPIGAAAADRRRIHRCARLPRVRAGVGENVPPRHEDAKPRLGFDTNRG